MAEIDRLHQERAKDADEIAQMLVRLAEAERTLAEANAARDEAVRRAETAEHSAGALRSAMESARSLLDELQRREEIATGLRMRAIEETRRAVTAESSHEPAPVAGEHPPGADSVNVDLEWDRNLKDAR